MFAFVSLCRSQGYRGCEGIYGPWTRKGSQEGEGLVHVSNSQHVEGREPVYSRHPGVMLPAPRCMYFFSLSLNSSERY